MEESCASSVMVSILAKHVKRLKLLLMIILSIKERKIHVTVFFTVVNNKKTQQSLIFELFS